MVGRGADRALRTESAVDFDAYGAIFTHSPHYSPPYSSLVGLIFFNCVLIFPRSRRVDDDQFHLMISIRSIFSCPERGKAVHNDGIEVMIAGHTHAWAEIQVRIGEFSLNVRPKKRLNGYESSHTRGPISYVSVAAIRY